NYSKISVKTWSPKVGAQVKLKIENADASIVYEVDLNTSVLNTWEELVYNFSSAPTADYVRVVIFFDFGNVGDDSVYYYDELALTN
ncbi:MAG: PKD domain protein, partial [Polaribacter sp.]